MTLAVKDRVRETSATAGTGTLTLAGAVVGFQAFSVIGDANTTYYGIVDSTTGDFEVGIGTYTLSGTTLSRTTVLSSSNAGSLVNFAANSKDVFVTYPSSKSVYYDASSNLPVTGALNVTSASATSLAIGRLGATTPAFTVDSSTASQVAGLKVTGAATGGTVAVVATDSGSNTNLTINAKGTGTIGIGSASTGQVTITPNTQVTGSVGIGVAPNSTIGVYISKNINGGVDSYSIFNEGTVQSSVTTGARGYGSSIGTQASVFTLSKLFHIAISQGTFGAGSVVTNQYGVIVGSTLIGATNNYGFYGDIASGTGRFNFYAAGTAVNYFGGNVGIGTTAPARLLSVQYPFAKTDTSSRAIAVFKSNDASNANEMLISSTGAATQASRVWNIQTGEDGVSNAGIVSLQPDGGNATIGRATVVDSARLSLYGGSLGGLGFATSQVSNYFNMSIDSQGGLTTRKDGADFWYAGRSGSANCVSSGGSWVNSSDERLKENIATLPDALTKVCSLRGVSFNRISSGQPEIGLIAQEVQQIYPDVVEVGDYLGLNYGALVGALVEAIKELKTITEAQAARITALETA
jgi:Chaperone of endosialidase